MSLSLKESSAPSDRRCHKLSRRPSPEPIRLRYAMDQSTCFHSNPLLSSAGVGATLTARHYAGDSSRSQSARLRLQYRASHPSRRNDHSDSSATSGHISCATASPNPVSLPRYFFQLSSDSATHGTGSTGFCSWSGKAPRLRLHRCGR